MSCQPPHWARRNVSPASKQRPVRATVPVSFMRHSPTKKEGLVNLSTAEDPEDESESPAKTVVEKPTVFLGPRGEKSKTLNLRTQPQEHYIRRTASLDAISRASRQSETPLFVGYCGHFMIDKATQTPEEWSEAYQCSTSQWKPMVAGGEQLEVKFIRQKLQRTNQNNRASGVLLCCQRQSPVQADHSAISSSSGSSSGTYHHSQAAALGVLHKALHTGHISGPIPIAHGPQHNVPRIPNSVEGLNQEIEKIVLKECATADQGDNGRVLEPPPEGHRAPIAELFHPVQSSTTGRDSGGSSSGGTSSSSHSMSPAVPIIPGNPEFSISPSSDDVESTHKLGTSPHINHFLSREPPDGCERVKIVDEPRRHPLADAFPGLSSSKPEVSYVLLPSQSSAFCPLYKELNRSGSDSLYNSYTFVSSTQTTPNCHK